MPNFTGLEIINGGLARHQKTTLVSGSITAIEGYEKDLLIHCNSCLLDFYNYNSVEDIINLTIVEGQTKYDLSLIATDIDPEYIKKEEVFDTDGNFIECTTREKAYKNLGIDYADSQLFWYIENDFVDGERKSYFVTAPQFEAGKVLLIPYRKQFVSPLTDKTVENSLNIPYRYFNYLCDDFAARIAPPNEQVAWKARALSTLQRIKADEIINKAPNRIEPDEAFKSFLRTGF